MLSDSKLLEINLCEINELDSREPQDSTGEILVTRQNLGFEISCFCGERVRDLKKVT